MTAYAFLAVIPIVPFCIILFGYGAYINDRKKASRLAMDVTTALLVGCVAELFNHAFSSKFGLFGIMLMMLIGGGLLGNLQYRTKGVLDMKRLVRAVWRLSFLILSVSYILLMLIGIVKAIAAV